MTETKDGEKQMYVVLENMKPEWTMDSIVIIAALCYFGSVVNDEGIEWIIV